MHPVLKKITGLLKKKRRNTQSLKTKMFLGETGEKKQKKTYKKRKNIHFQTHLDLSGQKKLLFYTYISVAVIIIGLVLFISLSNKFKVNNIEIIRQDNISDINIAYKAVNSFRGKSIFALNTTNIIERIYDYQNNINNVKIESSLPDTIIIYIASAKQIFNTNINDQDYIVTSNGSVVPGTPNTQLKQLNIINREDFSGIIGYKQILDTKKIQNTYIISELLEKNIIGLSIENINYLPVEREAHVQIQDSSLLIFDLDHDIEEQVEKVAIFHKERSPITQPGITYIDLRIDKQVFFCTDDTRNVCLDNLQDIYGAGL